MDVAAKRSAVVGALSDELLGLIHDRATVVSTLQTAHEMHISRLLKRVSI